jgi:hypothetical protein
MEEEERRRDGGVRRGGGSFTVLNAHSTVQHTASHYSTGKLQYISY